MNWQTEDIFEETKQVIADEGVFSPDQIMALHQMIDGIKKAVAKESNCLSAGINHSS